MVTRAEQWNHNIHYHPVILNALGDGVRNVLEVGCGDGMLARKLRRVVPEVVAIDRDHKSIELAKSKVGENGSDIDYILGDFLTYPFELASFEAVVTVATLHHMDAATALIHMRDLLKCGGRLAVVGLARSRLPFDILYELAAAVAHRFHAFRKTEWEHPSPKVWPPPQTYGEVRRLAADILPGARYRRHVLWRYSLIWSKPPG